MKLIFYIVLIAASAFCGWHFYPGIYDGMQEKIDGRKKEKEKIAAAAAKEKPKETNLPDGATGSSPAIAMLDALKGKPADPAANAKTTPEPAPGGPAVANTKPAPPPTGPVDEIEARYPMPNFKTIEEITKDWTNIPSRAFPKKIKTKVALTFDSSAGKVELAPGADINAVGMLRPNSGILVVMREGDDVTRVDVPLGNTDIKEYLSGLYERYKEYHRKRVVGQRERARALKERANGASEEQMKLAGPKPEVRAGGVIPVMLESIDQLGLKELKANAITAWGGLNFEEVDGTVYWTGTVQCTVENAIFGPTQTEMMALIKDGKVVKWLYTGSKEEVQ
ncbi:MAG TPA: hypothetical protein VG796_18400 [Verrucomicrobiales bacterium]|jgi:hypothetical protein|nr:hypothetical protein [Verrucomicrobiales bacterium]